MNNEAEKIQQQSIIIFGGGQQSMAIAKWFGKGADDILIVTTDLREKEEVEYQGFHVITLDRSDDESLAALGIGTWVKTIFCMFSDAARNVFITLSARALAPDLRILSMADTKSSGQKLLAAGASKVIDPYEITGNRISELMRHPLMVETLEQTILGKTDLNLSEIKITRDCSIKDKYLNDINLDSYNLILLGIVDQVLSDELIFNTAGTNHRLDTDDYLVVIGSAEEILRFRKDMDL